VVEEAPHGMTEGAPDKVVHDKSVEGFDDDVRRPVSIQTEADIASPEDNFRGTAVGQIQDRVEYWEKFLTPGPFVMGILKEGLRVPVDWDLIPEQYEEKDNNTAKDHYEFVLEEVARLVEAGQVVRWHKKPRCVNPLTVATKSKDGGPLKKRLVLDLSRCVNLACPGDLYTMATLKDALETTTKGDFQLVFDLKSAFHHIRLNPAFYELMGFKITKAPGEVIYYLYMLAVIS
jgi:hypothetical protein